MPATQSSGSGGATGSPPPTPTPPTTQDGGGGGAGSFLRPVIIGLVATLAIAAVGILGFIFLRRRMMPADPLKSNLPPSGARPWSRFRYGSMHGGTNLYNQQTSTDAAPSGGAASWAIRMDNAEQDVPLPFTRAQSMHGMQAAQDMLTFAQTASGRLAAQSLPPAQPQSPFAAFPQRGPFAPQPQPQSQAQPYPGQPNGGFLQAQPYPYMPNNSFPQGQPYPQMPSNTASAQPQPSAQQPNAGPGQPQPYAQMQNASFPQGQAYPQQPIIGPGQAQMFPQQPGAGFPQSQSYAQVQPNSGFIAPAAQVPQQDFPPQLDFPPAQPGFYPLNRGNGDVAVALDSASTSSPDTGNIVYRAPSSAPQRTDNLPRVPQTPRPNPEITPDEFPSLDDPFLRDTLDRFKQGGQPPANPNW